MIMKQLKHSLVCGLLAALTMLCVQLSFLLTQVSEIAGSAESELVKTAREAQSALLYSQAVLTSVRGTTEAVRKSAVEQMGYYEAAGRRSAAALARLELLISHTDARLERMTAAFESSSVHANENIDQIGMLAGSVRKDLDGLSQRGENLVEVSTSAVERLDQHLADDRLNQIADALSQSSQNTAQATANVAEATGYMRDILSPARKSFWRRLLELLIPRPTLSVP